MRWCLSRPGAARRLNVVSMEAELLAVSAAWDAALVDNDAGAVASFMADEWVFVSPSGITPRADIIEWIAIGRLAHHAMAPIGPQRVAIHGDVAILTARKASSGVWDGVSYTADEWVSEVFIRRDGRWTCVLSHKAAVEQDAAGQIV
jgi:ketosteroid isomerase-like protein